MVLLTKLNAGFMLVFQVYCELIVRAKKYFDTVLKGDIHSDRGCLLKILYWLVIFAVGAFCIFYWRTAVALEKPSYTLVSKKGRLEIRDYSPVTIASTTLSGSYDSSLSTGFRTVAGYIFGNNQDQEKIAMTAPVLVENPQNQGYKMAFVMPSESVSKGLPEPSSSAVSLEQVAWGTVAVWTFGGWANSDRIQREWEKMQAALVEQGISGVSYDMVAQYNPPMLPPPFRTNEIWLMMDVKQELKPVVP